jgi:hypothetical protein
MRYQEGTSNVPVHMRIRAGLSSLDLGDMVHKEHSEEYKRIFDRLFSEPTPVRLSLREWHTFVSGDRYLALYATAKSARTSVDDIRAREPVSWVDVLSVGTYSGRNDLRDVVVKSYEIHLGDAPPKPKPLPLAKCEAYVVPADGSAPFTMDIKSFTLETKR